MGIILFHGRAAAEPRSVGRWRGLVKQLVTVVVALFSAACFAHYDPPLPPGSSAASIPLSLGVVAEGTTYAEDEARHAIALLDRTEAGTRPIRLLGVSVHGFSREPVGAQPAAVTSSADGRLPFEVDE